MINADFLLTAYCNGFFPMADSKEGEISWYSPDPRAIFSLESIKVPRSLRQFLSKNNYYYTIDQNFEQVIRNCADREDSWISEEIIMLYMELHKLGYAHSVETREHGQIIGGLYGVSVKGAFFGESMFSQKENASKAAFFFLVEHLKKQRFLLLDSQFLNPFTEQLGAFEVTKDTYLSILHDALSLPVSFMPAN